MPNINERDVSDIKAGVDGVLSDVPEPSGEAVTETVEQEELPETTYAEDGYGSSMAEYPEQSTSYGANAGRAVDTERIHEVIEAVDSAGLSKKVVAFKPIGNIKG